MNYSNTINDIKSIVKYMRCNDLIIIYINHVTLDHLYLEKDKIYNNKFGSFNHNDFIGKPFGSKV